MLDKPILERLLNVLSHKFEKLFDLFLVQVKIRSYNIHLIPTQNRFYSEFFPKSIKKRQFCCRVKDLKNMLYGKI